MNLLYVGAIQTVLEYESRPACDAFASQAECVGLARETAQLLEQGQNRHIRGLEGSERLAASTDRCIASTRQTV